MKADHVDTAHCSAMALRKATRRVTQLYDEALKPAGLTITQFGLISELLRRGNNPPTVTDLANTMVMDRSGLGHTLRPLERDGYIILVQDKEDGRQRSVVLTEAGRKLHQKAKVLWEKAQRRFTDVVGRDEGTSLHAKLLAIAYNERLTHADD